MMRAMEFSSEHTVVQQSLIRQGRISAAVQAPPAKC
jgi:hypothetical protein